MWKSSGRAHSFAKGELMSQLRACGSGLTARSAWATVVGVCCGSPDWEEVVDNWKKFASPGSWTTLIPAGRTTQQCTSNQGCFWSALVITRVLIQVMEEPASGGSLLYLTLTNKEELVSSVKARCSLGCSDDEVRMGQTNWWERSKYSVPAGIPGSWNQRESLEQGGLAFDG